MPVIKYNDKTEAQTFHELGIIKKNSLSDSSSSSYNSFKSANSGNIEIQTLSLPNELTERI